MGWACLRRGVRRRLRTLRCHAATTRTRTGSATTSSSVRQRPGAGRAADREEYYQRYPGSRTLIASEWRRLTPGARRRRSRARSLRVRPARRSRRIRRRAPGSLGKYRIERELGRGAQGTVFLGVGHEPRPQRRAQGAEGVVVGLGRDGAALRARGPGARAPRSSGPRDASTTSGSIHGLQYFAMRYVEGRTLARGARERGASRRASARRGRCGTSR